MLKVEIPLKPVVERRYFGLKQYFDKFVELVEQENLSDDEYVVVVAAVKKTDLEKLNRDDFSFT